MLRILALLLCILERSLDAGDVAVQLCLVSVQDPDIRYWRKSSCHRTDNHKASLVVARKAN